jgi:hypothetical protein
LGKNWILLIKTGLTGAGKVWDDTGHEYQESLTRTIQITETQYQSLMDGIAIAKVDPPFYSILGGAQCTTWARMYVELNHPSNISSRDLCINRNNHQKSTFHHLNNQKDKK